MHLYLYILFYLLIPETTSRQIEIKCPMHCKCDIFENLKRATCTNRNLAVVESNIPHQTQILDLSFNQISLLRNNVFKEENLTRLKLLNMSHNIVSQIDMKAFKGLNRLKTLDLSYNGIQYIMESWFWNLDSLEELYLRGNSFSRFDNEPAIKSRTLKKLDLSLCRISYIAPNTFIKVPNLEILDLSENYLIHLNVATIQPLPNLNILNVHNNSFSCDGDLQSLSDYCVEKGIRFKNPCKKVISNKVEKFQRMMNLEPEDEKNSWIYDDNQEIKSDNQTKTNETSCNNAQTDKKSLLQEIVDLSPVLSIVIPFIYGIAVGILIAYTIHVFYNKKETPEENTYFSYDDGDTHLRRSGTFSRIHSRLSRGFSTEERQNLPLREWNLSESTPVLNRKNQANF